MLEKQKYIKDGKCYIKKGVALEKKTKQKTKWKENNKSKYIRIVDLSVFLKYVFLIYFFRYILFSFTKKC